MTDFLQGTQTAWAATSNIEIIAVLFGLVYIILAARENSWCWPAAFIGTGTSIYLFWDATLFMESALNVYYLLMAVFGWWQWQYRKTATNDQQEAPLSISSWRLEQHLRVFVLIAFLTLVSGYILDNYTQASLPYLDSFTTWSAVITTWMVAVKILENWLYWVVIDFATIFLYIDRGFYLYAALFILYIVIAIFGYFQWRHNFNNTQQYAG